MFKLETVVYAEAGAIKTVHQVKGSWREFVTEMYGDAGYHGHIFQELDAKTFSIVKMDEPQSRYAYVSGDFEMSKDVPKFTYKVEILGATQASQSTQTQRGTWLAFMQSMQDNAVHHGWFYEALNSNGTFRICKVNEPDAYYTFVEGDFDDPEDNGPGVASVPIDTEGFEYDHAVSEGGRQHTERRRSDRTWAEYMQGHADLALNTGVIFKQTGPDEFTLSDGKGRVERHTFLAGAYGAAKQKHIPIKSDVEGTQEFIRALVEQRPSWDEYGMTMAQTAALRADCTRRKVGAVLMGPDHSIISVGYNGGPSKGSSCLAGQCPRGQMSESELPSDSAYDTGGGTCVALHAEWNVLLRTSWYQFEGSTLYVTCEPCHICKVLIAGTAIVRVVAPNYEWTR